MPLGQKKTILSLFAIDEPAE